MNNDEITLLCPKTKKPINVYFRKITPAMAQHYLDKNHSRNRTIKKRQVEKYCKMMAEGNWNSGNGESIKISDKGTLLDGQHRLMAVIAYGKPVSMMVIEGICYRLLSQLPSKAAR